MVKSQGQIQKPYEKSIDGRSSSWNLISQDRCDPEHVPIQTVNKNNHLTKLCELP